MSDSEYTVYFKYTIDAGKGKKAALVEDSLGVSELWDLEASRPENVFRRTLEAHPTMVRFEAWRSDPRKRIFIWEDK